MSTPSPEQETPVRLTTRQWQVIDAVVDNEVSTRAEEGDEEFVATGHLVREAGWDQVAHWTPGVAGSETWPPADQVVTMTLTRDQWGLVLSSLDIWADIHVPADDLDGSLTPGALSALVSAQVGGPLREWPMPQED
ncbi:hypothetical protein F0L68_28935 [Solihabitans fulvus]|uniref:Uncharacterized protein n=1 Tax=Solihabitans fulvus TaxID=1892852 RepID=A0A5B2WZB4_9PSEU|nr:hypothetical protein [Solihabitans fulvus]KAA2255247.1 hypothetical protein F0L68_28935 [Solihabitans fulvus]